MRIDKVEWITAHNCGKPKWHAFTPSLSWKGKSLGLYIVSQNVPSKTTTEPKLVILVSFFSGKVTSYTDHVLASMAQTGASILLRIFTYFPCCRPSCCAFNFIHFQTSVIRLVDRYTWSYPFGIILLFNRIPNVYELWTFIRINGDKIGF